MDLITKFELKLTEEDFLIMFYNEGAKLDEIIRDYYTQGCSEDFKHCKYTLPTAVMISCIGRVLMTLLKGCPLVDNMTSDEESFELLTSVHPFSSCRFTLQVMSIIPEELEEDISEYVLKPHNAYLDLISMSVHILFKYISLIYIYKGGKIEEIGGDKFKEYLIDYQDDKCELTGWNGKTSKELMKSFLPKRVRKAITKS